MPSLGLALGLGFTCNSAGGTLLSSDTSLSIFTIDGVPVESGNTIDRPNATTVVEVRILPTDTNVTSMVALAFGGFPGNNSWPTIDLSEVVFDFDNMAVGENTLTIRVVAENGVTTQDHVITVQRLADSSAILDEGGNAILDEGGQEILPD